MVNSVELNGSNIAPVQNEELGLMHPPPKRTRREESISVPNERANNHTECSLPNDIIEEILGFLEIRKLVQCSILAKHFRYCFKYGKKLNFDLSFQRALIDHDQYQPIVHRIMDQHDGSKILSLKLRFTPTNNLDNQAMVAYWINKATQKGVEELKLNFDHGLDPFRVNFDLLFQIKTLKALYLVFVDLGSPTKDFQVIGLQFLKVCSMKKLNINEVILDTLLERCMRLEILEIVHCHTPDHVRFSARKLSKFRKLRLGNCIALRKITIDAPSLTTLHYSGQLITFNFENSENFVDFLLDLKSTIWKIVCVNHFLLQDLICNFKRIEVLTTTSLSLETLCTEFAGSGMIDRFYSLSTVKEINLTLEGSRLCNLFTMDYFFGKFSRCERLFIDVCGWLKYLQATTLANGSGGNYALEQQQPSGVQCTATQTLLANQVPARTYPHLEQLKLTGFRFKPNEMELLCYFLRSGHNLKTVAIFLASPRHWGSVVPDENVFNYNFRSVITSPNLWIKIYQHEHDKELYPAKHPKNWRKS